MPTILNSHVVPPPFGSQIGAVSGISVADLPAEPFRGIAADDGALPIVAPGLDLLWRKNVLGINLQELVRLDGHVRKKVRRVLVDAAEPCLV